MMPARASVPKPSVLKRGREIAPSRDDEGLAPPPSRPSDEVLLAGLGIGDPRAARAFVRRFQRTVFGVAVMVVGPALAEDVAQEAFTRAWRHAQSYDPRRGTVRSWLVRIAHNIAVDTLRARRATPVDPDDLRPLIDALTTSSGDSGGEFHDETRDDLRLALAALPSEQSRAAVMAAIHGFTAREIADFEGIPLGTAKARIRTALLKLHNALSSPARPV